MKRFILAGCALVALGACQPKIPDSAAGVGFDNQVNSPQARARRDAQLSGQAVPPSQVVSQETIPEAPRVTAQPLSSGEPLSATSAVNRPAPTATVTAASTTGATTQRTSAPGTSGNDASDIARDTQAALAAAQTNSGQAPLEASPSNPPPPVLSNPGISDENDFAAVGERRSLEADAAQRERNKANYTLIQPTEVPKRSGNSGPNIVAYALSTNNPRGTRAYQRIGFSSASRYEKNCAKYARADQAQSAFLSRGGPKVDRLGLDPDGDGYACDWDPSPFRKAARN
ncbi:hypothetical protein [Shimia abyssi]|uniref:Excalibur calcium-binding domain-containing protein n=1 Tax=Shimia abyssi TaxID=1662395 RepID=A0A2P8F8X9_9RHOB|nr:hypothetical protein [Shimia abyssi]PSL18122.1 hypothetical protein CLV88_11246 [Shimia abyssi]